MSSLLVKTFKRFLAIIVAIVLATSLGAVMLPGVALANCGDDYAPDIGIIRAVGPDANGVYEVGIGFELTEDQVNQLSCHGNYLEIDFQLHGFNLPDQWEGYSIFSNLPGAMHDVALSDRGADNQVPAVTGIVTDIAKSNHVKAHTSYYAGIHFRGVSTNRAPSVAVNWVPSVTPDKRPWYSAPFENELCQNALKNKLPNSFAYCLFGEPNPYALSAEQFSQYSEGYLPFTDTSHSGYLWGQTRRVPANAYLTSIRTTGLVAPPGATFQGSSSPAPTPDPVKPSAISRNDRTMDVFYKNVDGNLVARGWDVDYGWNYQWWPDQLAGNPVAVARKPEAMDIFYRRSDGSLWNRGWDVNSGWAEPQRLVISGVVGDPEVVSRSSGGMDVFWRTYNNELKNIYWDSNTGWSNIVTLVGGGQVFSNPTVAVRRADAMDLFYVGSDGSLKNLGWNPSNGWSGPVSRCSNVVGNPDAISRNDGQMSVFYHQSNGDLAECMWDWTIGWRSQSWVVPMAGDPSALVRDNGHVNVFYRKSDGTLWNRWWDVNSGWHLDGWDDHTTSDPVAVKHSNSTMDVFFRDDGSSLVNRGWDVSSGWNKQLL